MRKFFLFAAAFTMAVVFAAAAPASAETPDNGVSDAETIEEILASWDYVEGEGEILRLFQAFFGRAPDVAGAKYWIADVYKTGLGDLGDITAWFATEDQPEFAAAYADIPAADHEGYLSRVYNNMLGRTPDAEGFEYWLAKMDDGTLDRAGVVQYVAVNYEFIANYPFIPTTPPNPGDAVDCSDFGSHADAQQWYDRHLAAYGDVGQLDHDDTGIACEALLDSGRVYALGDSVMLGAADALRDVGVDTVDATVSRQFYSAPDIISGISGYDTLILHLGTNGPPTAGQFDDAMKAAAGAGFSRVIVLTIQLPDLSRYAYEAPTNQLIRDGSAQWGAALLDWNAASDANPNWLYSDGFHLTPAGRLGYAEMVADLL